MGQAMSLLVGGSAHLYSVIFGLLCLVLQVFLRYEKYVGYLKWLTLALLSYVAVVFTTHVPWGEVVRQLAFPTLVLDRDTILTIAAVFGTTISPYLFFWQAAQGNGGPEEPLRAYWWRRCFHMPSRSPVNTCGVSAGILILEWASRMSSRSS